MSEPQNPSLPFSNAANPVDAADILPSYGQGGIILVDCNGTLFDAVGQKEKGVNDALLDFLIAAERRDYKVYLHSGKPDDNMAYSVPLAIRKNVRFKVFMEERDCSEFEPILLKHEDIPSDRAVLTIDDEHGGGFASQAPRQWAPNDARMVATMAVWAKDGRFPAPDAGGPAVPSL